MRATTRLLAVVRPATQAAASSASKGKFLVPGAPTGLTGLGTHPSPRSALLYLYHSTLEKLKQIPEHSVYRQSVEAVTRHRLALVESVVPEGYDAWVERAKKLLEEHADQFDPTKVGPEGGEEVQGARAVKVERDGRVFVVSRLPKEEDERVLEWDGEVDEGPELEGSRTLEEKIEGGLEKIFTRRDVKDTVGRVEWEPEPQLTAEQVAELENKIGAGLIEEVIQVAEGELKLVDTMVKARVWEPLEEQPRPGQWEYFERKP